MLLEDMPKYHFFDVRMFTVTCINSSGLLENTVLMLSPLLLGFSLFGFHDQ